MRIVIPYLTTRIETDLMVTLLLTPLWWVLGFTIFIYHATVLIALIKLLVLAMQHDQSLVIPKSLLYLGLFIFFYAISILINVGNHPVQRILASINNLLFVVMGFLLIFVLYNLELKSFIGTFLRVCRYLCMISAVLAVVYLSLWFLGYKNKAIPTFMARVMPALLDYPYFYALTLVFVNKTEWLSSEVPRLTLFSAAPTATGGFMLIVMPMMMAYYHLSGKSKLEYGLVWGLTFFTLLFSMSRSALVGFVGAWALVTVLSRGKALRLVFLSTFFMMLLSGVFFSVLEWLLNFRKGSTVSRFDLYQQALEIVMERNLFLGVGARIREGFTMQAIGSHALYIEIIFVAGIIGLFLFILFQIHVLKVWFFQKQWLRDDNERKLWKYLGISIIGLDLWLVTDTLLAMPYIAYGYFIVTACIFAFDRFLKLKPHGGGHLVKNI